MEAQSDVMERLLALRGPLAKSWKPESRVFSQVIVVTLNADTAEPQIGYSFPTSSDVSPLAKNAMSFCFPEESSFRHSMLERNERDTFTFTLTQADGSRVNGYCRRFLIDGMPECYCILSTMLSMSIFSKMLDLMEQYRRAASGPSAVTRFLMAVGDAERPPPGSSIIVRVPAFDQTQRASVTHKLVRETGNQNVLDYVSMQDLFTRLSVGLVTQLVQALLLERRMILVSKDLGVLSNCVNALVALLNPFKWQHIFVPVLPRHLLDYCCAPMPFLIGIVDSFLPQVELMPLEDVAIVQLDRGELLRPAEGLLTGPVPPDHAQRLCAAVEAALGGATEAYCRTTDLRLLHCFTNFYRELLGGYREHFLADQPDRFDMEAFVAAEHPIIQPFLRALEEAQLWNTFVDERQSMNKRGMLSRCPLLCHEEEAVLKCKRCGILLQGNVYIRRGKGICFKCYSKGNALGKLLVKKVSTGTLRGSRDVARHDPKATVTSPAPAEVPAPTETTARARGPVAKRSWTLDDPSLHGDVCLDAAPTLAELAAAADAEAAARGERVPKLRTGKPARALAQKLASGKQRSRDDMDLRPARTLAASTPAKGSPRLRYRGRQGLEERQAKHSSKDDMCLPAKSSLADLARSSQHTLISSDEIISAYVSLRPSVRKITNAPMPQRAIVTSKALSPQPETEKPTQEESSRLEKQEIVEKTTAKEATVGEEDGRETGGEEIGAEETVGTTVEETTVREATAAETAEEKERRRRFRREAERRRAGWVPSEPSARQRTATADDVGKEARRSFLAVRSRAFLAELAELEASAAKNRRSTALGRGRPQQGKEEEKSPREEEKNPRVEEKGAREEEKGAREKGTRSPPPGEEEREKERKTAKEKKAKRERKERKKRKEKEKAKAAKELAASQRCQEGPRPQKSGQEPSPASLAAEERASPAAAAEATAKTPGRRQAPQSQRGLCRSAAAEVRSRAPTLRSEAVGVRPQSRQVGHMRRPNAAPALDAAAAEVLLLELVRSVADKEALDAAADDDTDGDGRSPSLSPSLSPTSSPCLSPSVSRAEKGGERRVRKVRAAPQRPICGACGVRMNRRPTDVSLFANGAFWHPTCFRCRLCSCSILPPYHIELRNGLPVHVECAAQSRRSLSSSPSAPLRHSSASPSSSPLKRRGKEQQENSCPAEAPARP